MNRSLQESYKSPDEFFSSDFMESDACVLSSHLISTDIESMIKELKQHCYNVCGVFFQNSCESEMAENRQIMLLDWDEKYYISNLVTDNPEAWGIALRNEAWEFCNHLLSKV